MRTLRLICIVGAAAFRAPLARTPRRTAAMSGAPAFDAAAFAAANRNLDRLEEEGRRRAKSSSAAPNQGVGPSRQATIAARAAFEARKSTIENKAEELFTDEGTDQSGKQIDKWTARTRRHTTRRHVYLIFSYVG